MKKCIKFPSIEQFRNVVTNVNRKSGFVGLDENGEAIYDNSRLKPKLTFKGTVKLHGTNAAVSYNLVDGLWAQSRENVITVEKDNAGFAFFVESNRNIFLNLIAEVFIKNNLDSETNTVTIYGEWCGGNIQKNVGIANLPKSLFIFGVKISPSDETIPAYWVESNYLRNPENKIYNIEDYQTYSIDIDFNVPQLVQNKLVDLTLAVEEECPVAKAFGFDTTIGEGIVWSYTMEDNTKYLFKTKGEKHAGKSKVKTVNKVDDVKIQKALDLADKVTPTWRLAQMLKEACGETLDRSKLGDYIRLVIKDIAKEDLDLIAEQDLEIKDITKYVSEISRKYFFEQEQL